MCQVRSGQILDWILFVYYSNVIMGRRICAGNYYGVHEPRTACLQSPIGYELHCNKTYVIMAEASVRSATDMRLNTAQPARRTGDQQCINCPAAPVEQQKVQSSEHHHKKKLRRGKGDAQGRDNFSEYVLVWLLDKKILLGWA